MKALVYSLYIAAAALLIHAATRWWPEPVAGAAVAIPPGVGCANRILEAATSLRGAERGAFVDMVLRTSRAPATHLPLVFAVMAVESGFRPHVVSDAGAVGLMQITPVGMKDAARHCRLKEVTQTELLAPALNVRYGTCYLDKALQDTGTVVAALAMYNGGYRQVGKLEAGSPLANQTANYIASVLYLKEKHCD